MNFRAGEPLEATFANLQADTAYTYRLLWRGPGERSFTPHPDGRFQTQRAPGRSFVFTIQGDSHPERPQMSHPALYARTLQAAAAAQPDFHVCMGDDFSVADAYLFVVLNWSDMVKFDLNPWPSLRSYRAIVGDRPAVRRAMQAEGLL